MSPYKNPERRKKYHRDYMKRLRSKLRVNVRKTKKERASKLSLEAEHGFPSYEDWKKLPYIRMWKNVSVEAYKLQKLDYLERRRKELERAKKEKRKPFDEASFPWAKYGVDLWKGEKKRKLTDEEYQELMSEIEEDIRAEGRQ